MSYLGILLKMKTHWDNSTQNVDYAFRLSGHEIPLNPLLGKTITLSHTGVKNCIACGRKIPKTFQQGYCFPCTQKLAQTDLCIVKPELCHFHKGTCRDNDFAIQHCFITHCVYIALSSHAKVGITREHQKLTRWADQGATQALELLHVKDRKTAGEIELHLSEHLSDKTNWRKMLMGESEAFDLHQLKKNLLATLPDLDDITIAENPLYTLNYPVLSYPQKIKSLDLDKLESLTDTLVGIKGQYLIFTNGVLNVRKYQGYAVQIEVNQ